MEEENKNEELESIAKKFNNFANTPSKRRAVSIANINTGDSSRDIPFGEPYTKDGKKYFRFYDNVRDALLPKEIEFIKQSLIEKGYGFE